MMTVTIGLLVSITGGPSSGFENNVGFDAGFCGDIADFNPFVNEGTNYKRRSSDNII